MPENCIDQWSAAHVTQVGDVYRIIVPLPLEVGSRRMAVRIRGIGGDVKADLVAAEAELDPAGVPAVEVRP